MDISIVLQLVKETKGIRSSNARDTYISAIINGVIQELTEEKGIGINLENANHLLFVTDYASWRYDHSKEPLPRDLQFRLHNMIIHSHGGGSNE